MIPASLSGKALRARDRSRSTATMSHVAPRTWERRRLGGEFSELAGGAPALPGSGKRLFGKSAACPGSPASQKRGSWFGSAAGSLERAEFLPVKNRFLCKRTPATGKYWV